MNRKLIAIILGAIAGLFLAAVTHANTLTWTDNSTNEDGFHIYRADNAGDPWVLIDTVPADSTMYVDAAGGKDACYIVTAFINANDPVPELNSVPSNFGCMPRVKPNPPGVLDAKP